MKRAVGYTRVSTDEQARNGDSLGVQKRKIRQYCELHELQLVGIERDEGLSGKSIKGRPGIVAVLDLVKAQKVDAVIVFKLDRLARNTREALEISELLTKKKVDLHSISERLDTSTASGMLFFTLVSAMATWERDTISERTRVVMAGKREQGERISFKAPFGFTFDRDKVVPDPKEQSIVNRVRTLSNAGLSIRKIIRTLAEEQVFNREGNPFGVAEIHKLCKKTA